MYTLERYPKNLVALYKFLKIVAISLGALVLGILLLLFIPVAMGVGGDKAGASKELIDTAESMFTIYLFYPPVFFVFSYLSLTERFRMSEAIRLFFSICPVIHASILAHLMYRMYTLMDH